MSNFTRFTLKHLAILASLVITLVFYIALLNFQPTNAQSGEQPYLYFPQILKQAPPPILPLGLSVLSNHSPLVSGSYLYVVGEVYNNSAMHYYWVRVAVNFFNSSGQLVDTASRYVYPDNLPAHTKTCFYVSVLNSASWSYYTFETPTYATWTSGHAYPVLTVISPSGSPGTYGGYDLIGQIRNDNSTRVEYVQVVGTLYNSTSKVIGCSSALVNSTHLDPNQISAFKIVFGTNDYSSVSSYRLQADGAPK